MDKRTAYKLVNHAVAKDLSRPKLSAPHLDEKRQAMVGADGFRLALVELDPPEKYYNWVDLIPTTYQVILDVSAYDLINIAKLNNASKGTVTKVILADDENHSGANNFLIFRQENMRVESSISCNIVEDKRGDNKDIKFAINSQYLYDMAMAIKTYQASYKIEHKSRGKKTVKLCPYQTVNIQINYPSTPVLFSIGEYREVILPMFVQW